MSSELSGSHGDRPEPGGDRPREHRPWDDPGRDVTPVPASAGWKPEGKFSRADYYDDDGTTKDRDPGAAREGHRADGDQGEVQADGGTDDPADAGSETRSVEDETVPGSEDSGLPVREIREETAEAAAAGGSDPPRRPPGGDSPHDDRPPGPGYDRVPPPGPRDQDPGEEDADRKPAPVRPEQRETPRGDAAAGQDTGTRAGDDDGQERQSGDQPAERRSEEQKPRDQVRVQHPPTDANVDQGNEATPDSAADQHPDDPRLAAMEQQMERMLSVVETMQDKLDASEAKHEREIDALKAENTVLREKVLQLESQAGSEQPEIPTELDRVPEAEPKPEFSGVPDVTEQEKHSDTQRTGGDIDQLEADAIDSRRGSEADRENNRTEAESRQSAFSPEATSFWKSTAEVAGTLGVLPPGADLVLGGDATRRAIEKMPPQEQLGAMRMGDAAGIAFSSMSPGTAVLAIGASVLGPAAYARVRDAIHNVRRKD